MRGRRDAGLTGRKVTSFALIVNLRADPYERMPFESMMYIRWYPDNIWLFVPVGGKLKEFMGSISGYPV